MAKTIHLTTYDVKTKHPTSPSVDLGVVTLKEAEKLVPGEPFYRSPNMSLYEGGICISWVRFCLPIDILES